MARPVALIWTQSGLKLSLSGDLGVKDSVYRGDRFFLPSKLGYFTTPFFLPRLSLQDKGVVCGFMQDNFFQVEEVFLLTDGDLVGVRFEASTWLRQNGYASLDYLTIRHPTCAIAGDHGHAIAGDFGVAIAGAYGHAEAGRFGLAHTFDGTAGVGEGGGVLSALKKQVFPGPCYLELLAQDEFESWFACRP
jgi:hypothetical protein